MKMAAYATDETKTLFHLFHVFHRSMAEHVEHAYFTNFPMRSILGCVIHPTILPFEAPRSHDQ